MYTNVYLQLLSDEIEDLGGENWTNGMDVMCTQHGHIISFSYDAFIPWEEIKDIADEHYSKFHFVEG